MGVRTIRCSLILLGVVVLLVQLELVVGRNCWKYLFLGLEKYCLLSINVHYFDWYVLEFIDRSSSTSLVKASVVSESGEDWNYSY